MKCIPIYFLSLLLFACDKGDQTSSVDSEKRQTSTDGIYETDGIKKKKVGGHDSVMAKKYSESTEWWAPEVRPKKDSPNVTYHRIVFTFTCLVNGRT